jgi:hypothetical protein
MNGKNRRGKKDTAHNCNHRPALFYVHPKDYKAALERYISAGFPFQASTGNKVAAWDALENMMATRH